MFEIERRILLVDDNTAIHEDFKQILTPQILNKNADVLQLEEDLFGVSETTMGPNIKYEIDDAYQGDEAVIKVETAIKEGKPYALAFVDVRMPPGIDGIQTIVSIWEKNPYTEIVICTAYSDYSWDKIIKTVGPTHHLLFIKKPFDPDSLRYMAMTLTSKWHDERKSREHVLSLKTEVSKRTSELKDMAVSLGIIKKRIENNRLARCSFLNNVSYGMRTPLDGILGMSSLLLDTDLTDEQRNFAEIIVTSGNTMTSVFDELKNYVDNDDENGSLLSIEFNVRTALETSSFLVAQSANERNIEIASLVHAEIPQIIIGDPEKIRRTIVSLSTIIIRMCRNGSILLSVFPEIDTLDTDVTLRFQICGNELEIDPKKWNDFFGAAVVENQTENENGIGDLFKVALEQCALLGGKIEKMSYLNFCEFKFILKFKSRFSSMVTTLPILKTIEGSKVLILGNFPTSRKVLSLYIQHWSGKCAEARTINEAIEMLHESLYSLHPFSMVIVDYKDEKIDTYIQTAIEIRKHKNLESIPLICITSRPKRGDTELIEQIGYCAYLTKPIRQTHLYNCIGFVKQMKDGTASINSEKIITKHLIDEIIQDRYYFLLIDTNIKRRNELASVLTKLGIRFDIAQSIGEGVRALEENRYDLLFIEENKYSSDFFVEIQNKKIKTRLVVVAQPGSKIETDKTVDIFVCCVISPPFLVEKIKKQLIDELQEFDMLIK